MFFLELSCFFYDQMDVGNLIFRSSPFYKSSLYIWKVPLHILLKSSLEDFEHDLACMWNECNCAVVWTFFALLFFGAGVKTDFFQSYATFEFSKFAGTLSAAREENGKMNKLSKWMLQKLTENFF